MSMKYRVVVTARLVWSFFRRVTAGEAAEEISTVNRA